MDSEIYCFIPRTMVFRNGQDSFIKNKGAKIRTILSTIKFYNKNISAVNEHLAESNIILEKSPKISMSKEEILKLQRYNQITYFWA